MPPDTSWKSDLDARDSSRQRLTESYGKKTRRRDQIITWLGLCHSACFSAVFRVIGFHLADCHLTLALGSKCATHNYMHFCSAQFLSKNALTRSSAVCSAVLAASSEMSYYYCYYYVSLLWLSFLAYYLVYFRCLYDEIKMYIICQSDMCLLQAEHKMNTWLTPEV